MSDQPTTDNDTSGSSWADWFAEFCEWADGLGPETPSEVFAAKVREEMSEWDEEPSVDEAIDVIATLVYWCRKAGYPPDALLRTMWGRLGVLRARSWLLQPNGTYYHTS